MKVSLKLLLIAAKVDYEEDPEGFLLLDLIEASQVLENPAAENCEKALSMLHEMYLCSRNTAARGKIFTVLQLHSFAPNPVPDDVMAALGDVVRSGDKSRWEGLRAWCTLPISLDLSKRFFYILVFTDLRYFATTIESIDLLQEVASRIGCPDKALSWSPKLVLVGHVKSFIHPTLFYMRHGDDPSVLQHMETHGADLRACYDVRQLSALHAAARFDRLQCFKFLLEERHLDPLADDGKHIALDYIQRDSKIGEAILRGEFPSLSFDEEIGMVVQRELRSTESPQRQCRKRRRCEEDEEEF